MNPSGMTLEIRDTEAPALLHHAATDIGRDHLSLAQPIFADGYADIRATGGFTQIDEATDNTVPAGLIQ